MVLRFSRPKMPTVLVDLGPGAGRVHDYRAERATVDTRSAVPWPQFRGLGPVRMATVEVRADAR